MKFLSILLLSALCTCCCNTQVNWPIVKELTFEEFYKTEKNVFLEVKYKDYIDGFFFKRDSTIFYVPKSLLTIGCISEIPFVSLKEKCNIILFYNEKYDILPSSDNGIKVEVYKIDTVGSEIIYHLNHILLIDREYKENMPNNIMNISLSSLRGIINMRYNKELKNYDFLY